MAGARARERARSDPWEKRAKRFARLADEGRQEWLFDVLGPLLRSGDRVLEIGAGTGRHVPELARRTQWVHAFEPSAAMRAELEAAVAAARLSNVQVSPEAWPPATGVVRADVAFSCHVLYGVEDAAAFLVAMTESARRLCALVLAPRPPMTALADLELAIRAEARPRAPGALEAFALLWQLGLPANLQLLPGSGRALRFRSDGDDLLELCHRLGLGDGPEDQARVRAALIQTAPEVEPGLYEVGTQGPHALITWPGTAGD